jgi:hypothetical protein
MRKDRHTNRRTDITKLTVTFRNFAKAPKSAVQKGTAFCKFNFALSIFLCILVYTYPLLSALRCTCSAQFTHILVNWTVRATAVRNITGIKSSQDSTTKLVIKCSFYPLINRAILYILDCCRFCLEEADVFWKSVFQSLLSERLSTRGDAEVCCFRIQKTRKLRDDIKASW